MLPTLTPANLPPHVQRQMRQTIYIEQAAEHLYDVATLLDDSLQMTWERLPQSQKARYRAEVTRSLTVLGIIPMEQNL
jgi:hypothetical protein